MMSMSVAGFVKSVTEACLSGEVGAVRRVVESATAETREVFSRGRGNVVTALVACCYAGSPEGARVLVENFVAGREDEEVVVMQAILGGCMQPEPVRTLLGALDNGVSLDFLHRLVCDDDNRGVSDSVCAAVAEFTSGGGDPGILVGTLISKNLSATLRAFAERHVDMMEGVKSPVVVHAMLAAEEPVASVALDVLFGGSGDEFVSAISDDDFRLIRTEYLDLVGSETIREALTSTGRSPSLPSVP